MKINILGHPAYISRLTRFFEVIGVTEDPVLLSGGPGVGKQVWIDYIIENSRRKDGPTVKVNCAELAGADPTKEIFADSDQSFLNRAVNGNLVLDQIEFLPVATQAILAAFLENRSIIDRSTNNVRSLDVRVMASVTDKQNIIPEVLYRFVYRLGIIPLSERKEDIPYLLKGLLRDSPIRYVRYLALLKMFHNRWDGNVRELKNYLKQTIAYYQCSLTGPGKRISSEGLLGEVAIRYFHDVFAQETWYYDYNFEPDFRKFFSDILTKTPLRQELLDENLVIPLDKKDSSYLVLNIWDEDFEDKALQMYHKFENYLAQFKSGALTGS